MKNKIKFNFLDVLIIIIIIALAFFAYKYLAGQNADAKMKNVSFTVEVRNVDEETLKNYEKGLEVRDGVNDSFYGKIVDVELKATEFINEDKDGGKFRLSTVQEQSSAFITVLGVGSESDAKIEISGQSLNVGKLAYIKGKGFAGEGYITALKVED